MKQVIMTIVGAAMTLCAGAQAKIDWLDVTHDFGAFNEELGTVSCEFRFVNTGTEDLVIVGARATCGCTKPRYPMDAIAPGDTAAVSVTYSADGRPGRFNKSVYIDANTQPERSRLTITGTVVGKAETVHARYPIAVGDLQLRQPSIQIGNLDEHHIKSVFIDGYNLSNDTIRPTVTNVPRWVQVTTAPTAVPPGEQVTFNFFVTADDAKTYGPLTDSVTYACGDARHDMKIEMDVRQVFPEGTSLEKAPIASLSTNHLSFEAANPADNVKVSASGIITTTVTLTNNGVSPLAFHRVYSPSPAVTVNAKAARLKKGKSTVLTIQIDPSRVDENLLDTTLLVITNDPLTPEAPLRLSALLR